MFNLENDLFFIHSISHHNGLYLIDNICVK